MRVVGAIALRDGQVFMAQRSRGRYAGCWEFPGGKVEHGESDADALRRELEEELAVHARIHQLVAVGRDGPVELWCYAVSFEGEPKPLEHSAVRWVPLEELRHLDTPPADGPAIEALTGL